MKRIRIEREEIKTTYIGSVVKTISKKTTKKYGWRGEVTLVKIEEGEWPKTLVYGKIVDKNGERIDVAGGSYGYQVEDDRDIIIAVLSASGQFGESWIPSLSWSIEDIRFRNEFEKWDLSRLPYVKKEVVERLVKDGYEPIYANLNEFTNWWINFKPRELDLSKPIMEVEVGDDKTYQVFDVSENKYRKFDGKEFIDINYIVVDKEFLEDGKIKPGYSWALRGLSELPDEEVELKRLFACVYDMEDLFK